MNDRSSKQASSPAKASGSLVLTSSLLLAAALSMLPAMLGPMMAPRVLPVFAEAICPGEPVAAGTVIVRRRARKGTSYDWHFVCRQRSGEVERAPGIRSIGVAWLFFSGGLLVTVTLANRIFARLDRRVTGGRP
jgi:hypothetical protein